jgi:hypothetical protein
VTQHIGDDAELYALGALDELTSRAVERHVLECSECAALLAAAQETAVALASPLPAVAASDDLLQRIRASSAVMSEAEVRRWFATRVLRYAVAAALILTFLDAGWQASRLYRQIATEDVALATMVHSHFEHVSMTPLSTSPLAAKVLYARDGSWVYVIADRPGGDLRVLGYGTHGMVQLGVLRTDGRAASLLVRPSKRVRRVVLERGNVPVAEATLK